MGFFRRIGRMVSRAVRVVKSFTPAGIMDKLLSKGLSLITKPLKKLADKAFQKFPFLRVLKPFSDKFLSDPLAFLAGGPMGMLASAAKEAISKGGLSNLLKTVTSSLGGNLPSMLSPQGLNNVAQTVAYTHAQSLLGNIR